MAKRLMQVANVEGLQVKNIWYSCLRKHKCSAWHCDSGDSSLSVFCWNLIHWLVKETRVESFFKLNQKLLKLSEKNGDILMDLTFYRTGQGFMLNLLFGKEGATWLQSALMNLIDWTRIRAFWEALERLAELYWFRKVKMKRDNLCVNL